jgi:hypothetical protein
MLTQMVEVVPKRSGFWLGVERYGPLGLTLVAIVGIYLEATPIVASIEASRWQVANLYTAVFTWSAIQTGFAFGVYGFVVGRSEGFIPEIRDTVAMKRFLRYVKRANIGGFLLTIVSLPLTIVSPDPAPQGSLQFFFVLLWFGLFLWTLLAFLRIAYSFGHLSSIRDQPAFYGA